MTLNAWIDANFPIFMDDNRTVFADDNGTIAATKENLSGILVSCSVPPKYSELLALLVVAEWWQRIFDDWKERGLVK